MRTLHFFELKDKEIDMRRISFLLVVLFGLALAGCTAFHSATGTGGFGGSYHFASKRKATGRRVFIFDPRQRAWAAYDEKGDLINTGRASGGAAYCSDIKRSCRTVVGTFRVYSKGSGGCVSKRFPVETNGGAPMPYCMHFHPAGYAIHGSHDVPNYNASHGCIRVTPTVAKWLNTGFIKVGSTVIVRSY